MATVGIRMTVNQIAKLFGLPEESEIYEFNLDYVSAIGSAAYDEALREGATEKEAEEIALKAEQEAQDDVYRRWHNGVTAVAEELFGVHGLVLKPVPKTERYPQQYELVPKTTWKDVLTEIMETMRGEGPFWPQSVEELKEVGPYASYREAVKAHLGWVTYYPEVYGTRSAQRIYEDAWR